MNEEKERKAKQAGSELSGGLGVQWIGGMIWLNLGTEGRSCRVDGYSDEKAQTTKPGDWNKAYQDHADDQKQVGVLV